MRDLLILIAFGLYLSAPAIAGLLGVRAAAFENRRPTPWPEGTPSSWLDAEAYAERAGWLRDALPLRDRAIALDSTIDYRLLGDSPSDEVLIGRDGELFATASLRRPCDEGADEQQQVAVLRALSALVRRSGGQAWVVLSPNKASIHPDRLGAVGERMSACSAERRKTLRRLLADAPDLQVIDLWTRLEAERDAGTELYPRLGRHWNGWAGVLQAEAIIEALAPGLWEPDRVQPLDGHAGVAELPARYMNLSIEAPDQKLRVNRPGLELTHEVERLAPSSHHPVNRFEVESVSTRVIAGRTVIVYDSFLLRSIQPLSVYFESLELIHWSELRAFPTAAGPKLAAADRVVFQLVEDRRSEELGEGTPLVLEGLRRSMPRSDDSAARPRPARRDASRSVEPTG